MSSIAPDAPLLIERRGKVGLLTLNRPQAINAINNAIREQLPQALADFDRDPAIAVIVLRGAGSRGFCAGADIKESLASAIGVGLRARLMPTSWIEALDRIAKPVIAVVHGACMGGGMELALACDIRIAATNLSIALPETALGLIPGGGGTQRLPRLIGLSRALDLLITGERIDAAKALEWGIVTRVAVDAETALADALTLAELIASRPPAAIAYVKEAAIAGASLDLPGGLRLEKSLFALLTTTSDRAEAAAAFQEKRTPLFTGT